MNTGDNGKAREQFAAIKVPNFHSSTCHITSAYEKPLFELSKRIDASSVTMGQDSGFGVFVENFENENLALLKSDGHFIILENEQRTRILSIGRNKFEKFVLAGVPYFDDAKASGDKLVLNRIRAANQKVIGKSTEQLIACSHA